MMMKKYQITLYCTTGEYKPVSCIITRDVDEINKMGKQAFKEMLKRDGIQRICSVRSWDKNDLARYHYTKMKMREYDEER